MHITRHRGAAGSLAVVVLALIVAAAAIGGIIYMVTIRMPTQQQLAEVQKAMLHSSGLSTPVTNKLDEKYTDANGDGIADPPSDPAQLIDPPTLTFSYIATDGVRVYVGADDGNTYALDAGSGSTLWTATGVTGRVTLANGVVYVAGRYGSVAARDAATGAILISGVLPTSIDADPIVASGWLYIAAANGKLYAFHT